MRGPISALLIAVILPVSTFITTVDDAKPVSTNSFEALKFP